mmetsp:Transcript_66007/g.162486  ORF Transcript_66007/g.162486 Transcript_66007/m.162486 type:complete len:117 (-) Transcript_66007:203-553(-)
MVAPMRRAPRCELRESQRLALLLVTRQPKALAPAPRKYTRLLCRLMRSSRGKRMLRIETMRHLPKHHAKPAAPRGAVWEAGLDMGDASFQASIGAWEEGCQMGEASFAHTLEVSPS